MKRFELMINNQGNTLEHEKVERQVGTPSNNKDALSFLVCKSCGEKTYIDPLKPTLFWNSSKKEIIINETSDVSEKGSASVQKLILKTVAEEREENSDDRPEKIGEYLTLVKKSFQEE